MEKRFLTEVEERFIRQTSALDHYKAADLYNRCGKGDF